MAEIQPRFASDFIGTDHAALADPLQQGALLWGALVGRLTPLAAAQFGERPALPGLDCGQPLAQADRQRGRKHLTDGVMVVVGGPLQKLEGDRIQNRALIENFECAPQLGGRYLRLKNNRGDDTHEFLPAERDANSHAGCGRCIELLGGQVIEYPAQRRIQGDL
jgi:hypothetical protein